MHETVLENLGQNSKATNGEKNVTYMEACYSLPKNVRPNFLTTLFSDKQFFGSHFFLSEFLNFKANQSSSLKKPSPETFYRKSVA